MALILLLLVIVVVFTNKTLVSEQMEILSRSCVDKIKGNVSEPNFWKFPYQGNDWKSKYMRIIPEKFIRSTKGAFEHRVVCSVRWGNSWQFWLERENEGLVILKEDWDEFVDTNLLCSDDFLIFEHEDTMFLQLRIFKKNGKEIISAPEPETEPDHPTPQNSRQETTPAFASGKDHSYRNNHLHVSQTQKYSFDSLAEVSAVEEQMV